MDKKKKIYFLIGISGSGKSKYIKNHFDKRIIVSPDELRKKILGDISDNTQNDKIWAITTKMLRKKVDKYGSVVLDAVNVVSNSRKSLLKNFNDCKKIAIIFNVDLEIARQRIKNDLEIGKDRSDVPDDILDLQYKDFINGYDSIKNQFDFVFKNTESLTESISKNKKQIIYFAHPMNTYNSAIEIRIEKLILKNFPNSVIENPNQPHHQLNCKKTGMGYFCDIVKNIIDITVILPFSDGSIGAGIYKEGIESFNKEIPVYIVDLNSFTLKKINDFNNYKILSIEKTRERLKKNEKEIYNFVFENKNILNEKLNIKLDQIFTKPEVATQFTSWVKSHNFFKMLNHIITVIEPSAGAKDIMKHFKNVQGFDIDPKSDDITYADFLHFKPEMIKGPKNVILVVGNPPFGRNGKMAIKFINKAAEFANYIAFILPVIFRRDALKKYITTELSLLDEYELPKNSFYNPSINKPINVPCVAQIWYKKPRKQEVVEYENDYIKYVRNANDADIAVNIRAESPEFKTIVDKNVSDIKSRNYIFFKLKKKFNIVKSIINRMSIKNLKKYAYNTFFKMVTVSDFIKEFNNTINDAGIIINPPFSMQNENIITEYSGLDKQKAAVKHILQKYFGYNKLKKLGMGVYGVAYDFKNNVIKITGDKSEAISAFHLINKSLKNVYKVYKVYKLKSDNLYNDTYAIIIEKLYKLSNVEEIFVDEARISTLIFNWRYPEIKKFFKILNPQFIIDVKKFVTDGNFRKFGESLDTKTFDILKYDIDSLINLTTCIVSNYDIKVENLLSSIKIIKYYVEKYLKKGMMEKLTLNDIYKIKWTEILVLFDVINDNLKFIKISNDLINGLKELQRNHIIYSDVHRGNVMKRKNGDIVLIDIGCSDSPVHKNIKTLEEDKIATIEKNIDIDVIIDKTAHAKERQSRNPNFFISDAEIINIVNDATPKIAKSLMVNDMDIKNYIHIKNKKDNVNIIGFLKKSGEDKIKFIVVTVMQKENFKVNSKNNKKIYTISI